MNAPQKSASRFPMRAVTAVCVCLLLIGILILRVRGGKGTPVIPVTRGEILRTVVVTGRVAPLSRVDVGSEISGRVAEVRVRGGDRVRRGDLLVQLDDREARAVVAQAEGTLAEAIVRRDQVGQSDPLLAAQRLREAEAALSLARATFERTRRLHGEGVASKSELDAARKGLEAAESQWERERLLKRNLEPGGSDRLLAASRVTQAEGAAALARRRLSQTRVLSPADGSVITRWVEPGDVVTPGGKMITLTIDGPIELVATVDEKNLPAITRGAAARVVADSFPDSPFDARVSRIIPAVDPQRGTVEVRFSLPAPPPFLLPDMTVSIEVIGERKQGVLTLPTEAIRDLSSTPWVLVVRDGVARRQVITTGIRGVGTTEVVSGLSEGDRVIPPTSPVGAGDRVRVRTGDGR